MESRVTATVLIALGGFGCEAAAKLKGRLRTRPSERPPDLSVLELPEIDGAPEALELILSRVADHLTDAVNTQLALSALVTLGPKESSLPWLDVFIVGDLAEAKVRALLPPLVDAIGETVTGRFANLLGSGAPRVSVLPLAALSRREPRPEEVTAILDRMARPGGLKIRPFLFEPQTARYILSRAQLVSTIVALVEQLVAARFRESEQLAGFLRGESPRSDDTAEPAPFAAAGLASVQLSGRLVRAFCTTGAALSIIDAMRTGPEIGLTERENLARDLRIDWGDTSDRLGLMARSEAAADRFETVLREEIPGIDCPPVALPDTPEEISRRKYGDAWLDGARRAIDSATSRLDHRVMNELADKMDGTGQQLDEARRERIRRQVDDWVWQGPRGWAEARAALCLLRDEAARRAADYRSRASGSPLPSRPDISRVEAALSDLRAETERRPRPRRFLLMGAWTFLIALLFGTAAITLLRYPLGFIGLPSPVTAAVLPPMGALLAGLAALIAVPVGLYSMMKQRHKELSEVRDDLARRVEHHLIGPSDSVLAHYLARLQLKRHLWLLRLARSERRRLEAEIARLDTLQRGLDTLWRTLQARKRQLTRNLEAPAPNDREAPERDTVLREVADPALLEAVYREVAPEAGQLAVRFLEALAGDPSWREELPQIAMDRIRAFLDRTLSIPRPAELLTGDGVANRRAREVLGQVLEELSTRLCPAAGLTEASVSGHTFWVISAPAAAAPIVDEALAALRSRHDAEALGTDWIRLDAPRDDGGIYLAVYVTFLTRFALTVCAS